MGVTGLGFSGGYGGVRERLCGGVSTAFCGISQGFMLYQGLIIQMGLPSLGAFWGLRKV